MTVHRYIIDDTLILMNNNCMMIFWWLIMTVGTKLLNPQWSRENIEIDRRCSSNSWILRIPRCLWKIYRLGLSKLASLLLTQH